MRQFVGRGTAAILSLARRYSLRHFLFRCAEPILSHLKGYFLGDLFELTRSVHQRIAASEQSLRALERQVNEILGQIEMLASREDVHTFAGEFQRRVESLASRGEVAILLDEIRNRIEMLVSRADIAIFADEIRSRIEALDTQEEVALFADDIRRQIETLAPREEVATLAEDIRRQIETLAPREEVATFAEDIRNQIETLVAREKITIFAEEIRIRTDALTERAARLESQSTRALGLVEILANRHILILGDELLARTPYGYLLAPTHDLGLATFLAEGVTWEQETSDLLDLTLKEGMTFVDVGANVGFHTLHAARAVGASGVVFAFEPTPAVFQLLQRSVHLNGLGNICRCRNLALSTSEGMATLHLSDVCGHNSLYRMADGEEKSQLPVKTAEFDAELQEASRIDVVKLDVEGAELDVLDGMKHSLANYRDILLIVEYGVSHLERLGIAPAEWFGRFFGHGFALFTFDQRAGAWHQVAEERAPELLSTNVVFVRPETKLWTLLKQHES